MHGYFIDMRLYRKAKSIVEPYSLNSLKQQKVKEKIDQERNSRVQIRVRIYEVLESKLNLDSDALFDALFRVTIIFSVLITQNWRNVLLF